MNCKVTGFIIKNKPLNFDIERLIGIFFFKAAFYFKTTKRFMPHRSPFVIRS